MCSPPAPPSLMLLSVAMEEREESEPEEIVLVVRVVGLDRGVMRNTWHQSKPKDHKITEFTLL